MSGQQTRYYCRTCEIEFVDGGWILADMGGRLGGRPWRVEDGCTRCKSAVEKVIFKPKVPGLDIPRDDIQEAPQAAPAAASETATPLPLRANDHHGRNDILAPGEHAPDPEPPSVDYSQWI